MGSMDFYSRAAVERAMKVQDVMLQGTVKTISVFLGQGHGLFAQALTFSAGQDPLCATVGQFNGDKVPDLAIANNTTSSLTILLGERK